MSATSWLAADPPPAQPPAPGEAQPGAVWRLPSLVLFAVVGLAYAAGAEAAVRALAISGLQAVFFIPAGVVAAALLRCPMRQWWVVLSAAAAAEAARDLTTGKWALAAVAGYVLANVTGPAVGAALTWRWCAAPLDLARRRHVAAMAAGAVLIGPAVAAAIGAGADRLFQGDAWWTTWWQWWLGDASGVALVGIALLAWGSSPDRRRLSLRSGAALLAVSAAASVASFAAWDLPLAFLVLVVVVLAGAVFGARAVALSTLAMASTAAVNLLLNPRGVIVGVADDTALVLIKAELMVFAFAGLWVAAEGFDRERHARAAERLRRRVEDERREAATLARLNEALRDYRLLFDQAVDGVFVADAAGRFLDLNGAGCAMLGYTPAELAGRPLAEVFAAEEAGRIEAEVGRLREDHVAHHRWLLRRRDGTLFIGELAGRRLPDGRIQGVLRDVTEQVRLAHALEESHERLRTLFDTSLDGILVTDEAGLVVSLNRAAGALFGYAEEELVGRHVSVLAPEPQRALRRAHVARFAASGEGGLVGRRLELDARRRDGSVFPVEVSVGELTLSDGRRFFTAAVHDIAARKAAEAQAAESYRLAEAQRSLLETVIGAAPVGMAVFDEEFRCLHLNQAMAAINGAPLEESLGRTVAEYLPRQWPQLEGVLTRALTEPLIGVEIEVADPTQPDGMQWRLANLYPVPLGGGRRGVAVVVTDITERKRSERSLAESEAQLRSLFSSIDEGFCVCEMVVDGDGRPVDYRFLELNPLFEEMTGLVNAAGRTALELVPDLEPSWIETYARVALGGETLRFEEGSAAMGRWFDVFAAPLGVRGRFAIVFKDQTQRRLAELAQRSAAARDAYRARLVDALRVVADPVEVQAEAAKALGEHLQATRVHYAEIDESGEHATVYADYHPDGAGMVGRRLLADYGRAVQRSLRAGETVVVRDVSGDPRLSPADRAAAGAVGVGAYVMVPLVKRGRTVAALVVQLAAPHDWTADELAVVGETAERTWAAVEQARAEKALRLRHARSELAARLLAELEAEPSFEAKLARVASALTPALADLALVEAPEREAPVLGAAHLDPAEAAALRRRRRRQRGDAAASLAQIAAGRAVLVNPAAGEGAGPPDAQLAHLAAELGAASLMAAPLELGGGAKGALVVGRFDPGRRPFSVDDLAFLREIAERVGVVLAAARLRQDEHDVAVRLQRALLPDELMWRPNVVVEARYDAASELLEVGGDWYDTYSWPDGRIGVLVGDVVGHNLESAAAMGRLRAATAALAKSIEPSPSALLEALDRTARGKDGTSFATAVCVIVDPVTGRLDYSSAGHPPVLVLSPGRSPRRLEDAPSPPLCAVELRPRPEASVQLEPGSLVVLYSDGLIERRRERLDVGLERLERAGERLADLPTSAFVDRLVEAMAAGSPSEDDVVVAAFRYTPVVGVFERTIRPDAGELAVLRGELRAWLEASGLAAATRRRVLLAVGEACTNAVEHAYREGARGPISVELTDHRYHVVARIRDRGNWLLPRNANPYRGKGTGIMQDLSDRFVRRVGFDGTEVTLLLPADPPLERALAAAR